ncbi:hypothetical protein BV25DRAFT_601113 [Artomyces pyxidatus]|uniref:Uncharacterized protein n=1 Tax=Artomyces pyxidatus TaxID=48021 RepID=A0ACB8T1K8_9AGAM|nr:hypothetical protein BV25DRAFT_601113 [Artomyces pyxidatus]
MHCAKLGGSDGTQGRCVRTLIDTATHPDFRLSLHSRWRLVLVLARIRTAVLSIAQPSPPPRTHASPARWPPPCPLATSLPFEAAGPGPLRHVGASLDWPLDLPARRALANRLALGACPPRASSTWPIFRPSIPGRKITLLLLVRLT